MQRAKEVSSAASSAASGNSLAPSIAQSDAATLYKKQDLSLKEGQTIKYVWPAPASILLHCIIRPTNQQHLRQTSLQHQTGRQIFLSIIPCLHIAAALCCAYNMGCMAWCRINMKRPGSAEGNGLFANLGSSSKGVGGPAVLKPLAPPPSYTPPQVLPQVILITAASSMV